MKVITNLGAAIQVRTLRDENRQRIDAWFDRLKNWESDSQVRSMTHKLPNMDVYVLRATDGYRIFFSKDEDTITILDIATKETIDLFAGVE